MEHCGYNCDERDGGCHDESEAHIELLDVLERK